MTTCGNKENSNSAARYTYNIPWSTILQIIHEKWGTKWEASRRNCRLFSCFAFSKI